MSVLALVIALIIGSLITGVGGVRVETPEAAEGLLQIDLFQMVLVVFVTVFIEELLFRTLPIFVARWINPSIRWIFAIAVIATIVFGYIHGGVANIFIQGVAGLFFAIIYIKGGGYHGRHLRAWCAAGLGHYLYNMLILFPAALLAA